jgi:hypothetical protein
MTGTAAEITSVANILDNKFEVYDLIKDLSSDYETLVGKNSQIRLRSQVESLLFQF